MGIGGAHHMLRGIFGFAIVLAVVALAMGTADFSASVREDFEVSATRFVEIAGPYGCVGQAGARVGVINKTPEEENCASGVGLRSVHHVALSADDLFIYAASGTVG